MDKRILVQDMQDPRSICAALQQALNAITAPANIQALLAGPDRRGPLDTQVCIDGKPNEHALATFNVANGVRGDVVLHTTIYGSSQNGRAVHSLPPGFAGRLRILFEAEGVRLIIPLHYNGVNDQFWGMLHTPRAAYRGQWRFEVMYVW